MPRQRQTRELLIEHAVRLLEEVGPSGFTAREVARRVGVSHAAPFRHFPGKFALLAGAAASGYRDLETRLSAVDRLPVEAWRDAVIARAIEYVSFAKERPAIFEVMFRAEVFEESDEIVQSRFRGVCALLLGGTVDDGEMDSGPVATSMLAAIHGLAVLAGQGFLRGLTSEQIFRTLERNIDAVVPATGDGTAAAG